MRFEARLRASAARYASVRPGFLGASSPRTGAEKATDGAGRSGYADRPTWLPACDLPLQAAGVAVVAPPCHSPCPGRAVEITHWHRLWVYRKHLRQQFLVLALHVTRVNARSPPVIFKITHEFTQARRLDPERI